MRNVSIHLGTALFLSLGYVGCGSGNGAPAPDDRDSGDRDSGAASVGTDATPSSETSTDSQPDSERSQDGASGATSDGSSTSSDGGSESSEPPGIPEGATFEPVREAVDLHLRLNKVVYLEGDAISVELDLSDVDLDTQTLGVALVSQATGDVEIVELSRGRGNQFVSTNEVRLEVLTGGSGAPNDGVLEARPDENFFALFAPDQDQAEAFEATGVGLVFDFGLASRATLSLDERVDEQLAVSDDEEDSPKPAATLLKKGGYPVQIATHELLAWPASDDELDDLIERTGGSEKFRMEDDDPEGRPIVLIEVDPSQAATESLDTLRALYGDEGALLASREEGLAIYSLVLELLLDGYVVALNPKLQMASAPTLTEPEATNLTHSMKNVRARGVGSGECVPGDDTRPCVENVPALWAYMAIFDKDEERVPVGVLDIGFAPNDDFREPSSGFVQCDMTAEDGEGYRCGDGRAEGAPTVGNSFFGDKSWHGTGVVTTLGGIPYNNFGAAGVAGQVAEPMMYRYDFASYAFEMGRGIVLSTSQGASCINISGGYPCNMLTNVGPDFDICSVGGRLGICSLVTASAHAAAATVCATLGWIPFVGAGICAAAVGSSVAVTDTCIASLGLEDLSGPMGRGVSYAKQRGVPVVTIAGNALSRSDLPPVVRDLADIENIVTEDWGIIPAMAPDAIVVGAVGSDLSNEHFVGDRVDVWAPISSAYMAPELTSDPASPLVPEFIGGTSAAAPYVAGLIAAMQAANPELNPQSGEGDPMDMVDAVKSLLLSPQQTFDNDQLVDWGYPDEPLRRKLVNPLAAVRAAAQAYDVPNLDELGYDLSLNFSEVDGPNDSPATASLLEEGATITGTIYTVTNEDALVVTDVDHYRVTAPAPTAGARAYAATVELRYPTDFGGLEVVGEGWTRISDGGAREAVRRYVAIVPPEQASTFLVQGVADEDNVYKVDLSWALADYAIEVTEPTADTPVCAARPVTLRAEAAYQWDNSLAVPDASLEWYEGSTLLGTGASVESTFSVGMHTVTLVPFGDSADAENVTFEALDCQGDPPAVQIAVPSGNLTGNDGLFYDGYDDSREQWYVDVQLVATSSDAEDGALPDASLSWTTNRTDLQPEQLGDGQNVTVRLYSDDCFGVTHRITLVGQDSDGNYSAPVYVDIFIYTLC